MDRLLQNSWWMLVVRGLLAIAFGVLALAWPGGTLLVLVALFAAWALVGGVAAVVAALKNRETDRWWLVLLLGIVSIAAGVIAMLNPETTILVLVLLMGVNALATGVLEIVMAVRLRKTIEREWLLGLAGAVSVAFGLLVLFLPTAGAIAMVWLISFYALLSGMLLLALGWQARKWAHNAGAEDGAYKPRDIAERHPGQPAK